jgi:lipoprotein-releasing system permease protein
MYKVLLCLRYLRTRWIALASIISVTLGVATMIVVNSVMSGFGHEMMTRLRGTFADLSMESTSLNGFPDHEFHMNKIREVAGDRIIGMTPTVHVPAMMIFTRNGQNVSRQVMLIGVDEKTQSTASDMSKYLLHPENRKQLSFDLRDGGYDFKESGPDGKERQELKNAGWEYRRTWAEFQKRIRARMAEDQARADKERAEIAAKLKDVQLDANGNPVASETQTAPATPNARDLFKQVEADAPKAEENRFDPAKHKWPGAIVGKDLIHHGSFLIKPGDDVKISFISAGMPPQLLHNEFTVVDIHESKMTGHDSSFVFVPLADLQEMRGMMIDHERKIGRVNAIQIRCREDVDLDQLQAELAQHFDPGSYRVSTWQEKVGPLLSAVQMEKSVLNLLLFLIIAVAGFGILAIFFMIVVEKTKDIGILKALGASRRGIMGIFLSYGLSLGIVGSGMGMLLGLLFVWNINSIRTALEHVTGQKVFDPSIYYFYKIPTIVEPFTVAWIVCGAMLIAVLASILPAIRAAKLHPVEALRYE